MQATRHTNHGEADVVAESDTGSLPDWLINLREYYPQLQNTQLQSLIKRERQSVKTPRRLTPMHIYGTIN